jgi:DNA polymerase III alpha subunit
MKPIDLGDRQLWPDGDFTVDPDKVTDYIFKLSGKLEHLKVTHLTKDIEEYNQISDQKILVKESFDASIFPPCWVLPDSYKYSNLNDYLIGLADKIEKDSLYDKRIERLSHEIWVFEEQSLDEVLRCLIYGVETMREKNVVWGVGRGSSCSSYLLFLLGLHSVDPVKYDIDFSDFIKLKGN